MNFLLIFNVIFLLTFSNVAFARPPRDMQLSYNFSNQTLHVELNHVIDERTSEYIRKLVIEKNGEEPVVKFYRSQPNAFKFAEDVKIPAEVDDVIKVKAYASEGGTLSAEIVAAENVVEENGSEPVTPPAKDKKSVKPDNTPQKENKGY